MKPPAILIVDDDEVSLRAAERIAWLLRFAPVAAPDSGAALDRVRRGETFAAIMARVEMKMLGGRELVAQISRAGVVLPALFFCDRPGAIADLAANQRALTMPFSLHDVARELDALGVHVPIWPRAWQSSQLRSRMW